MTSAEKTIQLHESWLQVLQPEFEAPYFKALRAFLVEEKSKYAIYPPGGLIFNALNLTPFDKVKVVLLGQDPYHGAGQAHGLCFSVQDGIRQPPSLVNIFKEISSDINVPMSATKGNLESWAKQGVLLLNATLTVRANTAGSHQGRGWETFTDKIIQTVSNNHSGLVFILWGRFAQNKETLIDGSKHLILKAAHPSPFSAYSGFFGCKHFSKTNQYLQQQSKEPIDWVI
jgi:uracil-DNA glycosylase